jgi:hypothetical protein
MVAAGASPLEAMQVTGHRSLAMIERYSVKTHSRGAKALTAREKLLRAKQGRSGRETRTPTRHARAKCAMAILVSRYPVY